MTLKTILVFLILIWEQNDYLVFLILFRNLAIIGTRIGEVWMGPGVLVGKHLCAQ